MRIWEITTRVMLNFSFCVSPIDARRFGREHRHKVKETLKRLSWADVEHSLEARRHLDRVDWRALLRPRQLMGAIKKYHMCNNLFFFYLVAHLLVLVYVLMKASIHRLVTGSDLKMAKHLEEAYYFPRFFQSYKEAGRFYNLTITVCLYALAVRFVSLHRLIKNALINNDYYKRFNIVQINLAYMMFHTWNISDWLKMIRFGLAHGEAYRRDSKADAEHRKLNEQLKQKLNSASNRLDLIYHTNIIDFSACFRGHERLYEPMSRRPDYQNWFCSRTVQRCDPYQLAFAGVIYMGGISIAFFILCLLLMAVIYLEVINFREELHLFQQEAAQPLQRHLQLEQQPPPPPPPPSPPGGRASGDEISVYLEGVFAQPWRLIRLFDIYMLIFSQLPSLIDCVFYLWDVILMFSRTLKLIRCFRHELSQCLRTRARLVHELSLGDSNEPYQTELDENLNTINYSNQKPGLELQSIHYDLDQRVCRLFSQQKQRLLKQEQQRQQLQRQLLFSIQTGAHHDNNTTSLDNNKTDSLDDRLRHMANLTRLLHAEFLDLKSWHSYYVNIMILASGFCLAYCFSILLVVEDPLSVPCGLVCSISSATQLSLVVFYSLIMDWAFKELHRTINRLVYNGRGYLDKRTVDDLMIVSSHFERPSGRSIQIVGQYSLTLESLGPLLVYISTCAVLLSRI